LNMPNTLTSGCQLTEKDACAAKKSAAAGRLFVLEVSAGRIHSMNTDGSDKKTIVTHCRMPDGIAVDAEAGHIYWTNQGSSHSTNDGSIEPPVAHCP
jgi:hypothetical protein